MCRKCAEILKNSVKVAEWRVEELAVEIWI